MHIANEVTMNTPVRVGLGIVFGLVVLIGVVLVVRPEMMSTAMGMVHGLVVGFGL